MDEFAFESTGQVKLLNKNISGINRIAVTGIIALAGRQPTLTELEEEMNRD